MVTKKFLVALSLLVLSCVLRYMLFSEIHVSIRVGVVAFMGFGFYILYGVIDSLNYRKIIKHSVTLDEFTEKAGKQDVLKHTKNLIVAIVFLGWTLNGIANERLLNISSTAFYICICSL